MTGQSCEDAECHQQKGTPAADNHWQQNGKHGAADIGFVRTGQADALHNQSPNAGDKTPANRNDEQRLRGASCKTNNAQGGLVGFFRSPTSIKQR